MESNSLLNTYGSSQLILQVEGGSISLPLEVQGIIDKNIKVYRPLAIINNTYFIVYLILLVIGIDNINKIKLNKRLYLTVLKS